MHTTILIDIILGFNQVLIWEIENILRACPYFPLVFSLPKVAKIFNRISTFSKILRNK